MKIYMYEYDDRDYYKIEFEVHKIYRKLIFKKSNNGPI